MLARGVIIGVLLAGCTRVDAQPQSAHPARAWHDSTTVALTDATPDPAPAVVPVFVSGSVASTVADAAVSTTDHVLPRPAPSLATLSHVAPLPGRLLLIGDSIVDQLCAEFPNAQCVAFPGAWVADVNGVNLADGFVTQAQLRESDTVVLSSIGGWHTPGVDDSEILHRLQALYQRISSNVQRLVVLVPPYPNFILCLDPSTPEAVALLGERHDELCHTQQLVADLERSWPVTEVPIIGPYLPDEEHQTPQARHDLARAIQFILASDPATIG